MKQACYEAILYKQYSPEHYTSLKHAFIATYILELSNTNL